MRFQYPIEDPLFSTRVTSFFFRNPRVILFQGSFSNHHLFYISWGSAAGRGMRSALKTSSYKKWSSSSALDFWRNEWTKSYLFLTSSHLLSFTFLLEKRVSLDWTALEIFNGKRNRWWWTQGKFRVWYPFTTSTKVILSSSRWSKIKGTLIKAIKRWEKYYSEDHNHD